MAETEEAKLNFQIFTDVRSVSNNIKTLQTEIRGLKKAIKETDNEDKKQIEALEKELTRKTESLAKLKRTFDGMKGFKTFMNLLSGRTANGKFADHSKWVVDLSKNLGVLKQVLATVKIEAQGLSNALNQAKLSGILSRIRTTARSKYFNPEFETTLADVKERNRITSGKELIRRSNLSDAEREAEDLARSQEKLQKRLGTTQLQIMANYTVINRLAGAFKGLINYTVQYDEELHQLQAISAMSNASLDKTRQTIEAVAVSTEFTSLELAKASTVLAQAGLSASQIQGTLPAIAKLATATGTDLATSTDVITSAMNIYNLQMHEAEHVTNALTTAMNESKATIPGFQTAIQYAGNMAAQLGVSFEETTAAISAATQAGIRSKSMLGTGLRAVMTEFLKPTNKLIAQLEKVGLTVDDIDVKTKGYVNVLKTLKQAGFGVTEAFRGMERRGAAFLVSQINQTEFMDDLRMKMASSTAAAKANETQMEALAKQVKNFQNVLGTAGTQGLEPFVRIMSELLQIFNKLSQTKIGGGILSALLTGGGAFAAIKSWQMLYGSFTNLMRGLGLLTNKGHSIGVMLRFLQLQGVSIGKWEALKKIISGISFAGWVGTGAVAITTLYQLAKATGLFTTKLEKAQQVIEETKGQLEDTKTEQQVINEFINSLTRDREKLKDPVEVQIRASEILDRLPKAAEYINATTKSVDDLREALVKLNQQNLDDLAKETKQIADASKEMALDKGAEAISSNLGLRFNTGERKAFITAYERLRNGYGYFNNGLGDFLLGKSPLRGREQLNALYNNGVRGRDLYGSMLMPNKADLKALGIEIVRAIRQKEPLATSQDVYRRLNALASDKQLSVLAPMLNELADSFKNIYESGKALNNALTNKGLGDSISKFLTNTTKSLSSFQTENRNFRMFEDGSPMSETSVAQAKNLYSRMSALYDETKMLGGAKSYADIGKVLGISADDVSKLKQNTDGLKDLTPQGFIDAWNNNYKDQGAEVASEILEEMKILEKVLISQGFNTPFMDYLTAEGAVKSSLKKLADSSPQELEKNRKTVEENINNLFKIGQSKEGKGLLSKDTALNARNNYMMQMNSIIERAEGKINRLLPKIDPIAARLTEFFNDIDMSVKQLSTTYKEAIKPLEEELARQQGRISAAERVYGSSSGIVQAEQTRARYMEQAQSGARLAILSDRIQGLIAQRNKLRSDSLYKEIMGENPEDKKGSYNVAYEGYRNALAGGNYGQALTFQNQMNKLSANYKKFAEKDDALTKSIDELTKEAIELQTILEEENRLNEMSMGGQIKYGVGSAMTNYAESNKNLMTIAGSAEYLSTNVISELDSGFTTMFQNIISKSKSASEAFRDFGRQVLETIRDIAIQMAVKQGLSALFGSFGSGGISESGGISSVTTFTKAVGGLITGPIPNRDSVPTKLMPGEYVLKKSAVDVIGRDYLDSLNNDAAATLNASAVSLDEARDSENTNSEKSGGGVVNVYVVGQEQQQAMTPNDVLITITQDMLTGGQTKRLVKQISMGAL